jgi:hypothetical protein
MEIPVYNEFGIVVYTINVNDSIQYVNGRVSKGIKHYYKGLGVPYSGQHLKCNKDIPEGYTKVGSSSIFYMGDFVRKRAFENKFGIFQEPYQPQFTDFIGTCGQKELYLIYNSEHFARSSIRLLDVINHDDINNQYYFKVDYLCDRKNYISDNGNPVKLQELLDYMIKSSWCFIWDKRSINDITPDGLVSDVADLYESNQLGNQLGSVYSVLRSLYYSSVDKYMEFCRENSLSHINEMSFIFNALIILAKNNVDISELIISNNEKEIYQNIVLNYLITEYNCASCGMLERGDAVKEQYLINAKKDFGIL